MWIVHWFPAGMVSMIAHAIIIAGLVLYAFSKVVKWIPTVCQFKLVFEIAGFIFFGVGAYIYGGYNVEQEWRQKVAAVEAKLADAEARANHVNTVVEKYYNEKVTVIREKAGKVHREIIERREEINKNCTIDDFVMQIYNRALTDPDGAKKKEK